MVYRVPRHIWRTTDNRLVPAGHVDAAFLAYPEGTELPDADATRLGVDAVYPAAEAAKMRARVADKSRSMPANKGGLTIHRNEPRE